MVVSGKLVGVARRRPASVQGDGISTIAELVDAKNLDRGPSHIELKLDDAAILLLQRSGLTIDSVPDSGQRVFLRRASNIHQGGDAVEATDELSSEEIEVAEAVARAIPGLKSFGADILFPRAEGHGTPRVLEVNSNPMISLHHYPFEGQPRDVASAIIDGMFPATRGS